MAIDAVGGRHAESLFEGFTHPRHRGRAGGVGAWRGAAVGGRGIDGDGLGFAFRQTGSTEAKSQKGRSRSPLKAEEAWLLALIAEQPDVTLEEIRDRLAGERGMVTGISSIWRFFDRHGISFKKNRACR
jgi:hypothetical protein